MSTKSKKPFLSKLRLGGDGGVAAIEFAMLLPLFLFITMGIIEFSVLLYDKAMITNASREGARTGSLFDTTANVTDVVNSYLQNNLISLGAGGSSAHVTRRRYSRCLVKKALKSPFPTSITFLFCRIYPLFSEEASPVRLQLVADTVMRKENQE